jgi:hypothetical protein
MSDTVYIDERRRVLREMGAHMQRFYDDARAASRRAREHQFPLEHTSKGWRRHVRRLKAQERRGR